jgi:hypothetical protein
MACLAQLQQTIAATTPTGPLAAKRAETLTDVAQAPEYAALGALIDHLFVHSASDGKEISLLEKGASLWKRAVELFDTLTKVRSDLEAALDDPGDPASASRFNHAAMNAQRLASKLNLIQSDITALRKEIAPLPHLLRHPRQEDKKASGWDWGNFLLARRTDAFVRAITQSAKTPATRAFAFGVLSSYGTNAAGSAYLGHVVGGPRRAHRFRDRLARNAVGSYLARNTASGYTAANPSVASLSHLAREIRFGSRRRPSLPQDVVLLIEKALNETFDLSKTVPAPNLETGYRRLLRHLELLDSFVKPAPPPMPSGSFTAKLYGDPTNPPPSLRPQDVGVVGDPGGGVSVSVGSNSPGSTTPADADSQRSSGSICGAFIALLVLVAVVLVAAFIECAVEWAKGQKCNYFTTIGDILEAPFKKDPPDPHDPPPTTNPGMTSAGLTAFAGTEEATRLVGYFFDLHLQIWESLDQAYNYLAVTGLIYPDGLLDLPRFRQFVQIPPGAAWPHRVETDPQATYHLPPSSPIENPPQQASPYPQNSPPSVFLTGLPTGRATPTASVIAWQLWEQMASHVTDSTNLDLDADRGFHHACWDVKGSINDDPVAVTILDYTKQ